MDPSLKDGHRVVYDRECPLEKIFKFDEKNVKIVWKFMNFDRNSFQFYFKKKIHDSTQNLILILDLG